MLQKNLRGLTPTTFWFTPEALTATLLLKMNRGVLDVAQFVLALDARAAQSFNSAFCFFPSCLPKTLQSMSLCLLCVAQVPAIGNSGPVAIYWRIGRDLANKIRLTI